MFSLFSSLSASFRISSYLQDLSKGYCFSLLYQLLATKHFYGSPSTAQPFETLFQVLFNYIKYHLVTHKEGQPVNYSLLQQTRVTEHMVLHLLPVPNEEVLYCVSL